MPTSPLEINKQLKRSSSSDTELRKDDPLKAPRIDNPSGFYADRYPYCERPHNGSPVPPAGYSSSDANFFPGRSFAPFVASAPSEAAASSSREKREACSKKLDDLKEEIEAFAAKLNSISARGKLRGK